MLFTPELSKPLCLEFGIAEDNETLKISPSYTLKTEQEVFSHLQSQISKSNYKYIIEINFLLFFPPLGLITCLSIEIIQVSIQVLQGGGVPKPP